MPRLTLAPRDPGRTAYFAAMLLAIVALAVATQGCTTTRSMAFAVDLSECPCNTANCVCWVPKTLVVDRGDEVHLINTSLYTITLTPEPSGAFKEGNTISIAPGTIVIVTVSKGIAKNTSVTLNMQVQSPGVICPGEAGPRMEVDD